MTSGALRITTLIAHFALIALLVAMTGASIGLLLIVPLLAPVRGFWRGDRYTYAWSAMLIVFYCAGMLSEAYMRPTMAWTLRIAAFLAAIEFVSAVLFVRVQAMAARAAAEARPPAARTEA